MEFYMFMWWLLAITAGLILLSSIDELFLDIAYLVASVVHQYKMWINKYEPLTVEKICSVPEKKIAIMVACWHEHLVIEDMLRHNIQTLDYKNYDFFVGVYPNDELTIHAVTKVQNEFNNVFAVVNKTPGPSTKADNLNNVYNSILAFEKEKNIEYEIFLFHDAEDVIHPLSLKLYNYLIPRKDMIQTPVLPLEVNHSSTVHWTYNDEFAENHLKVMFAREVIGGLVTSAGVGTAFSRAAIELLTKKTKGALFEVSSLTEDYHVSLEIHLLKLKSIFLTQRILRTQMKKKWWLFGKPVPKKVYELIATRALFPTRYMAAVRQRARWITGITLQEWRNTGWPGSLATRYTLFHDRKTLITHIVNFVAYVLFIYWLIYYFRGEEPSIALLLQTYPAVYYLILACTLMMILRLFYRAWASYQLYGLVAGILSIPRSVCSNVINFHALLRAYRGFFFSPKKESTKWDKTNNTFPSKSTLKKYTKKLGDLLLENKIITPEQLKEALVLQTKSHDKLGKILIEHYSVAPDQVLLVLGKQFNMDVIDHSKFPTLTKTELNVIAERDYDWLISKEIFPVAFLENMIVLALVNPAHEQNNNEAIMRLKPYAVKFVLLSDAV
jgi:adsorption protein B